MKVGVLNTVIGGADDGESFARAKSIGCAGVEVVVLREQLRRGNRVAGLRSAMRATGLDLPSFVLDEHNLGGIASPDPGVAAAAAEDVRAALSWAAELGVGAVLVPFFVEAEIRDEDAFERTVAAFSELCPLAEAAGVVLAFEGTLAAARVRELARRIGSESFACYFDLANPLVRALDPPTEIRALGDLICRVHVKDLRARKNDCHPGLGLVPFPRCAEALAEIGYDGWLVLETPAAPVPVVERDVAFTRATFGAADAGTTFGAFSYELESWDGLVDTFGRLGLGAVQLGSPLLDRCLDDPAELERGRSALGAGGLKLVGLAGYRNLTAPDVSTRRANILHIERCLETAPALGTYVVATEAGTLSGEGDWTDHPDNWSKGAWALLEAAVEELLPAAADAGVVLALEGHPNTVLKTYNQLIDVLERFPSPHLQLVCDPYNYFTADLLPAQARLRDEFLDRFESRFVLAHLKDVGLENGVTTRPEFGTGVFEQRPYLEFLRRARPDLPFVLEHLPLAHVPAAVERVRALLG